MKEKVITPAMGSRALTLQEQEKSFQDSLIEEKEQLQTTLFIIIVNESSRLIAKLSQPCPGVPVEQWETVSMRAVLLKHLSSQWLLDKNPDVLANVNSAIKKLIEGGAVPRNIRIPRYESSPE